MNQLLPQTFRQSQQTVNLLSIYYVQIKLKGRYELTDRTTATVGAAPTVTALRQNLHVVLSLSRKI
jgi:hypothetical protein